MTSRPVPGNRAQNTLRRIFHSLTEVLHVSTAYLGVAVLVFSVLVLTMSPLREQVKRAHVVLYAAFTPGDFRVPYDYARPRYDDLDADDTALISPVLSADELTLVQPPEGDAGHVSNDPKGQVTHLNFTRALADSEEQSGIPGVSATQEQSLRSYISRKYRVAGSVVGALISTVFSVGREMDLDPQLLLAVIAIESRYNPYAESHMGAQGLMQVMTKVHKDKFAAFGEGPLAAVHPLANIQVGAQILSDCIKRRGSLDGGLACYVGATGPGDGGYGAKVKAERRRIALASGIPIAR